MIDQALMQPLQDQRFRFVCDKSLPCFTRCCADLNLVLTPYDVLQLRTRLNLSSEAFLKTRTTVDVDQNYAIPLVKLRMNDDEMRHCPFVSPEGCVVYEHRPSACRLYPLGRAASQIHQGHKTAEYYFIVKESHCLGLNKEREWTVQEWIADQGLEKYNAINDIFIDMTASHRVKMIKKLSEQKLQMYYMAGALYLKRHFWIGLTSPKMFSIVSEQTTSNCCGLPFNGSNLPSSGKKRFRLATMSMPKNQT